MFQDDLKPLTVKLHNKVVLNVDDNEMNRLVLFKIFQGAGIKTIDAENGAVAVKKLQGGLKPDFILMDLEMPVMNGIQASEYIRNHIDADIPIIVNSGSVSAYHRSKMKILGIHDFLEKPYSLHDIFSKLLKHVAVVHA
jgi:CheY-like chemotaxis protein